MRRISETGKARPAWRTALLAALVLGGAAACERGLTSAPGETPLANTGEGTGAIAGRVLDAITGEPIPGAVVSTPGRGAVGVGLGSDFIITGLTATDRLAATASAPGYAPSTAIYRVIGGITTSREIRLLRRGPRLLVNAGTGGVVPFAGGGRITIPPNAFAGVKPGESVGVEVAYYDPASDAQLAAAPGDFRGVEANGERSQIETGGMVDVRVTNAANQPVSVAPGQTVTINFPDPDGAATTRWGLYRFDTNTGNWVRTGDAPPAPDGTQQAQVPSLDRPWNADQPLVTTCITVKVEDLGGAPRVGEVVTAEGLNWRGPSSGMTDAGGNVDLWVKASAQADVSAGTATLTVTTPAASQSCTPGTTLVF